jgi:DNA-binding HxlR family transcriptional regulator
MAAVTKRPKRIPKSSVQRTVSLIGDGWVIRILRDAFRGTRRFTDFFAGLGIPKAVLANRLERLVEHGIFERREYQTAPARSEYRLTPSGLELWRVLIAMWNWETTWYPTRKGYRLQLNHEICAHAIHPLTACSACGEAVTAFNTQVEPGPGAGFEAAPAARAHRRTTAPGRQAKDVAFNSELAALFGDRWSSLIIASAFRGFRRFGELKEQMNIPPALLSQRFNELVASGVLSQRPAPGNRTGYDYHLTRKGIDVHAIVLQLMRWGDRWLDGGKGPPLILRHAACGHAFVADLRCDSCLRVLERTDLRLS